MFFPGTPSKPNPASPSHAGGNGSSNPQSPFHHPTSPQSFSPNHNFLAAQHAANFLGVPAGAPRSPMSPHHLANAAAAGGAVPLMNVPFPPPPLPPSHLGGGGVASPLWTQPNNRVPCAPPVFMPPPPPAAFFGLGGPIPPPLSPNNQKQQPGGTATDLTQPSPIPQLPAFISSNGAVPPRASPLPPPNNNNNATTANEPEGGGQSFAGSFGGVAPASSAGASMTAGGASHANNPFTFVSSGGYGPFPGFRVSNSGNNNATAAGLTASHLGDESFDQDSVYSSSASSSCGSSVREDLPLCADDSTCPLVNDKQHQRTFAHTCRLFPCYHARVKYHSRLFRHVPGQCASDSDANSTTAANGTITAGGGLTVPGSPGGIGPRRSGKLRSKKALTSVNFAMISPEAPNAEKITIICGELGYEIYGDWSSVKVHTLKRYLHQVLGVAPVAQRLFLNLEVPMDDDLATVASFGVCSGTVVRVVIDEDAMPHEDGMLSPVVQAAVASQRAAQQQQQSSNNGASSSPTAAVGLPAAKPPASIL